MIEEYQSILFHVALTVLIPVTYICYISWHYKHSIVIKVLNSSSWILLLAVAILTLPRYNPQEKHNHKNKYRYHFNNFTGWYKNT